MKICQASNGGEFEYLRSSIEVSYFDSPSHSELRTINDIPKHHKEIRIPPTTPVGIRFLDFDSIMYFAAEVFDVMSYHSSSLTMALSRRRIAFLRLWTSLRGCGRASSQVSNCNNFAKCSRLSKKIPSLQMEGSGILSIEWGGEWRWGQ